MSNRCAASCFRRVTLGLTVLLSYGSSIAQSQAVALDTRLPSQLAQLLSGDQEAVGYYDTVDAAWAAYLAYLDRVGNTEMVVSNFRPCVNNEIENQYGYEYGQPLKWCHDSKIVRNGEVISSRIVSYVSIAEFCPVSYDQANWSPLRGRGNGGDAYIFERRCEKSTVLHHPQSCGMGNPIYPAEGAKRQVETDYMDPLGRLTFSRTYDSARGTYSHSMAASFIAPVNGAISGCEAAQIRYWDSKAGAYAMRTVCSARLGYQSSLASFVNQNSARYRFNWNGLTASPVEKYNNDRLASVAVDSQASWLLSRADESRSLLFDAQGKLTKFFLNSGGQVRMIYSSAAIAGQAPAADFLIAAEDDLGRRLQFFYGSTGLMEKIITPDGQSVSFDSEYVGGTQWRDHGSVAKVKSVTYPGGATKSYVWDEAEDMVGTISPNRLTGVIDENLERFATFKYSNGQALSTEHSGAVDKFALSDARVNGGGTVSVTDPSGAVQQLTYGLVDGMSRLMSRKQPAGSGCEPSTSALSYDTRGNVSSRVDFNGAKSCHAYASDRNVEMYRIEGLGSAESCPTDLSVAQVDPNKSQRKVSTKWHPEWKLEAQRAEPKRITTAVYNGQKDPIKKDGIDVICAPAAPTLPDGSKIAVVCTRYEQSTDDETGNLGFDAPAKETRKWSYTYNQFGQVLTETDPKGKPTAYEYWADTSFMGEGNAARGHQLGDLKRVTNALNQQTNHLEYNKRGQVLTAQYSNGSQEQREYHVRGWLTKVTLVPAGGGTGQVTQYDYFDTGLLRKVTQPDGSYASYTWDDAHRLIEVSDSLGNKVTYKLDNAGNRERETFADKNGVLAKTISRTFDALGRMSSGTGLQ